jgi:hypothetical protein
MKKTGCSSSWRIAYALAKGNLCVVFNPNHHRNISALITSHHVLVLPVTIEIAVPEDQPLTS